MSHYLHELSERIQREKEPLSLSLSISERNSRHTRRVTMVFGIGTLWGLVRDMVLGPSISTEDVDVSKTSEGTSEKRHEDVTKIPTKAIFPRKSGEWENLESLFGDVNDDDDDDSVTSDEEPHDSFVAPPPRQREAPEQIITLSEDYKDGHIVALENELIFGNGMFTDDSSSSSDDSNDDDKSSDDSDCNKMSVPSKKYSVIEDDLKFGKGMFTDDSSGSEDEKMITPTKRYNLRSPLRNVLVSPKRLSIARDALMSPKCNSRNDLMSPKKMSIDRNAFNSPKPMSKHSKSKRKRQSLRKGLKRGRN